MISVKEAGKRNRRSIRYVYIAIAAVIIGAAVFFAAQPVQNSGGGRGYQVGDKAPDFSLETPGGSTVSLADLKGKPAIINFWASWCPFCVDEMPLLERVARENGMQLVFINLQESRESALSFADRLGIESPILLDPDSEAKRDYNVFTQPVTYFLDANGIIRDRKFGPLTEEELREKIGAASASSASAGAAENVKVISGVRYLASVDPAEILSGGPPKDGIPSIDRPKFESAEEAGKWLRDDDLVLALSFNGAKKAYPVRILNWHEIVNDFAGNTPIAVTYCPLCRTGIAYERVLDGKAVEFGTSGKLYRSDLVMYDRLTETYWSQVLGQGIRGELAGVKLKTVPMDTVQWKDWKALHPETLVLSRDTGFPQYQAAGRYDITDLYGTGRPGFAGIGVDFRDTRLASNAIVYGVEINAQAKAYEESAVRSARLINDEVGGQKIVVVWDEALQAGKIFRTMHAFSFDNGIIVDENKNAWTVARMESELERINSFPHFWFAWAAFFPGTALYGQ